MSNHDYSTEKWMVKDGSIFTIRTYDLRSDFPTNRTIYKIHGTIAFNVGEKLALRIVEDHNYCLEKFKL